VKKELYEPDMLNRPDSTSNIGMTKAMSWTSDLSTSTFIWDWEAMGKASLVIDGNENCWRYAEHIGKNTRTTNLSPSNLVTLPTNRPTLAACNLLNDLEGRKRM
jgi:hypothetical protein